MTKQVSFFDLDQESSNILKGVAILLVMLGHAQHIKGGGGYGVTIFLLLSGFGLHLSCEKKGLAQYWRKRCTKVWFPYMLAGCFFVVALGVHEPLQVLCTVVGLDLGLIADKTMWYISFIMLWYIAYYCLFGISSFVHNKTLCRAILLIGLFLTAFFIQKLDRSGFWHEAACAGSYAFLFPLGVLLSCTKSLKVNESVKQVFWIAVVFLCASYFSRCYLHKQSTVLSLAISCLPLALSQVFQITGVPKRILLWFGKYSFPLYLFEGLVVRNRNEWFSALSIQPLIDLCFLAVTALMAVVFWRLYETLLKMIIRPAPTISDAEASSNAAL